MPRILMLLHSIACVMSGSFSFFILPFLKCGKLLLSWPFAITVLSKEGDEVNLELLSNFHLLFLLHAIEQALEHTLVVHLIHEVTNCFIHLIVSFNKIVSHFTLIIIFVILLELFEIFDDHIEGW